MRISRGLELCTLACAGQGSEGSREVGPGLLGLEAGVIGCFDGIAFQRVFTNDRSMSIRGEIILVCFVEVVCGVL